MESNKSFLNQTEDKDDNNFTSMQDFLHDRCPPVSFPSTTFYSIYSIVFLVGIVGNSMLITMFTIHKSLRTAPHTLLLNLAVADLSTLLLCAIGPAISLYPPPSDMICVFLRFITETSINTQIVSLTGLSAERYFAICKPFRVNPKKNATPKGIVLRVTFLTLTIAASLGLSKILLSSKIKCESCLQMSDPHLDQNVYIFVLYFILYPFPVIVIAVFYILMAKKLYFDKTPTETWKSQQMQVKKRAALKVLMLCIVYTICFSPHHILSFNSYFSKKVNNDETVSEWKLILFCSACLHIALGPIILYFFSKTIRIYFNKYIFCSFFGPKVPFKRQVSKQANFNYLRRGFGNRGLIALQLY